MTHDLEEALKTVYCGNLKDNFDSIANILMGEFVIQKGDSRYAIVEIEFYLYSNTHKDYIVYPRSMGAGRWFFHLSGMDLTFESSASQYGGILIRGLYKLNSLPEEEPYIFGPQKCVDELWDNFNALKYTGEYPVLSAAEQKDNLSVDNMMCCKRCININGDDLRTKKIREWANRIGVGITENELESYRKDMFDRTETQLYRYFNLINGEDPYTFTKIPSSARPRK